MTDIELVKLENRPLWREVRDIAKEAYALLDDLPEEERWGMESRLRQSAFEATSALAEAYGSVHLSDIAFCFSNARKALFVVKNVYVTGHKVGVIDMDPKRIVRIDAAIKALDAEITSNRKAIQTEETASSQELPV